MGATGSFSKVMSVTFREDALTVSVKHTHNVPVSRSNECPLSFSSGQVESLV